MREIPVAWTARVLAPAPVLLISSRHERKANLAPLTRYQILSHLPMLIGWSLAPSSMTCHLVRQAGECLLAVPDVSILSEVHHAGVVSGRDRDKLKELHLLLRGARRVGALVPGGALASLECEVRASAMIGADRHFVAEVVSAEVEDEVFEEDWRLESAHWFHHLGGLEYLCKGRLVRPTPLQMEPADPFL